MQLFCTSGAACSWIKLFPQLLVEMDVVSVVSFTTSFPTISHTFVWHFLFACFFVVYLHRICFYSVVFVVLSYLSIHLASIAWLVKGVSQSHPGYYVCSMVRRSLTNIMRWEDNRLRGELFILFGECKVNRHVLREERKDEGCDGGGAFLM